MANAGSTPQNSENNKPLIYFLCNSNCGKSQMAEAIMRLRAGDSVDVRSAGVKPGSEVNAESVASLSRIGADMSNGEPTAIDGDVMATADRVIVVGGAEIPQYDGMKTSIERWEVDEPSLRGIHGDGRMDLLRDEIDQRVQNLVDEL